MNRVLSLGLLLLLAAAAAFGQAPGFGANGAAGATLQGGDPAETAERIQSFTQYRLTPGDVYLLSVTQDKPSQYSLVLQENYDLDIPYMGVKNVRGMYFFDLRKMVVDGLRKLLPLAQFISLSLQTPARFDVGVFGDVQVPGLVTVYSLSRVSDALALAKSRPGASIRQITLTRDGGRISVDLLRYAGEGTSDLNPYLEPGDKIYVPHAQNVVILSGAVAYPGSFELIPGETLATLIAYAGGTLPDAQTASIQITRSAPGGTFSQSTIDLSSGASISLGAGDRVRVPSRAENKEMILVTGAVFGGPVAADKPVPIPTTPISVNVPYTPGLSLLEVLETLGGPTPYAKARESLVIRGKTGERLPIDVETLWSTRDQSKDIPLEPGDAVNIPMVVDVFVTGEVRSPGKLPYNPSLVVSDYLVASGGINPDTADPNGIYFVDRQGGMTRASLTSPVAPGAVILVGQNAWAATQRALNNVALVTSVATTVIGFLSTLIGFIRIFVPNFLG